MTLVEFLDTVKRAKRETLALSVLYWYEHYGHKDSLTAAEVKSALIAARIPNAKNINMADVLSKAGPQIDVVGNAPGGSKLWSLTETGRVGVRKIHGLIETQPEIQHSVTDLREVIAKVTDADVRTYLEEALMCISVDARRAAIVFVWVSAVAELESRVWAKGAKAVTIAVQKNNLNAKALTKKDDLLRLKEVQLLQVAEEVGVLDKSEKQILDQALTTRNQSGHPNKYRPGVSKVKSHIEDIIGVLWI